MSRTVDFDAVVIGAGPSGSSAAFHLAQLGYRVLLVEKDELPREKVCGDGLTPRTLAILDEMGIGRLPGTLDVYGVRFFEHRNDTSRIDFFEGRGREGSVGSVLPRYTFDHALLQAAVRQGAEARTGTAAVDFQLDADGRPLSLSLRSGDEIVDVTARFYVVSEGSVGRFGRLFRRSSLGRNDLMFAVRQYIRNVPDVEPLFDIHFPVTHEQRVVPGYGWVFPVSDDVVNVGAGFTYGVGYEGKIRIRQLYDEFMALLREKDERYRDLALEHCTPLIGASLRVGLQPEEAVRPRLLAAGDAAALVNPFNGEGISYALESGRHAADAIHEALAEGSDLATSYPARLRDGYRRHTRLRRDLPRVFGLVRLYEWHPPSFDDDRKEGLLSPCVRDIVSDHERRPAGELRALLWEGILDEPQLASEYALVDGAVIDEVGAIVPLFGEMAYYTREGVLGLPGYLGTLLLLATSLEGGCDESDLVVATAGELILLATNFHRDVRDRESESGDAKTQTALAILVGDTIVAKSMDLLNRLDAEQCSELTRAFVRHARATLERYVSGAEDAPPQADADFAAALVSAVLRAHGAGPPTVAAMTRYARHLTRALTTVHDLWVDAHGHELDDSPLYLTRRSYRGDHVIEGERRGIELRKRLISARGDASEESERLALRALMESGAVDAVLETARREAAEAERAAGELPEGAARVRLERWTANARRAIDHTARRLLDSDAAAARRPRRVERRPRPDDREPTLVLVDADDRAVGLRRKLDVHRQALLHRAFSVFVFNSQGELLLQSRARVKYHSGGLWTNTCCGHPGPGEDVEDVARARLREEMGFDCELQKAFRFSYRAELGDGIFEHEVDHVFVGTWDGVPSPDPDEADDWRWIGLEELRAEIGARPEAFTVWLREAFEGVAAHWPEAASGARATAGGS